MLANLTVKKSTKGVKGLDVKHERSDGKRSCRVNPHLLFTFYSGTGMYLINNTSLILTI